MTWRDEGYVEALQQETIILAKRVMAARSRLLLSTCFDASPTLADRGDGGQAENLEVIDEEVEELEGRRWSVEAEEEERRLAMMIKRYSADRRLSDAAKEGRRGSGDKTEARDGADKNTGPRSVQQKGASEASGGDPLKPSVQIGEGFNVEDWRQLKESFIL